MGVCGSSEYDNRPYVPPNAQRQSQGQAIPVGRPVGQPGQQHQQQQYNTAGQGQQQYNNNRPAVGVPIQQQNGYNAPPAYAPTNNYTSPSNMRYPVQQFHDLNKSDEIEPMLLLDVTGSMEFSTAPGSSIKRRSTVEEAIGMVIGEVAKHDSQAANEQGEDEEGGGIRTVTFADGRATDIGDLNPMNWRQKWQRIHWGGGTYLAVGWQTLKQVFNEEFGNRPVVQQPKLLALIVTDGEAVDNDQFVQLLAREPPSTYVVIALLGHGSDHEIATRRYTQLASSNNHVKLVNFGPETDPSQISSALTAYLF